MFSTDEETYLSASEFNEAMDDPESIVVDIRNYYESEVGHFKNKYKLEFNVLQENSLIIPEYKIELFNKNKKIINRIENIEKIEDISYQQNYTKKKFTNNKFKKNFMQSRKFKKKNNYDSKIVKKKFENKKLANY